MPVVGVKREKLFKRLEREYTEDEFQELCFEYGIELDDVTSEAEMLCKELGDSRAAAAASEDVIFKIDIPANRYDMLCLEGIARALNVFRSKLAPPKFTTVKPAKPEAMVVDKSVLLVRPFVVCAVLRGVQLDQDSYSSFIDLQDKLHQNLCRQRSLVAIGTHDLDKVKGPFTYAAAPPSSISFVPLKQTRVFRADELLEHYLTTDVQADQALRKFVPLIKDSPVYPVIRDSQGVVLSLPPIINGSQSAITLDTRNVFIECTATDLTKAKIVLNTVVTMFSEYCSTPFEVEAVQVTDALGALHTYPDLGGREMQVPAEDVNKLIGIQLSPEQMAGLLTRMQMDTSVSSDGQLLNVLVPPTRSDVLHTCDVAEDVAIAHGYNNIVKTLPSAATMGRELPLNQLCELLRVELAMAGFSEILTWALCSRAENFSCMRREQQEGAVEIGNPATQEFQVGRTHLLASALKTVSANKDAPLPVKLFEVSDVLLLDSSVAVGARNERHVVAVQANKESSFEVLHGLLNRVMDVLGVPLSGTAQPESGAKCYHWKPSDEREFFPGRQAHIFYRDSLVGAFGVVHPEVLEAFEIVFPVAALELNLEPFCFDQTGNSLLHERA